MRKVKLIVMLAFSLTWIGIAVMAKREADGLLETRAWLNSTIWIVGAFIVTEFKD